MKQSTYDAYLLHRFNSFDIVDIQIDDTFILADDAFAKEKEKTINKTKIITKPREMLIKNNDLKFNDGIIKLARSNDITLTQERHIKSIKFIEFVKMSIISSRDIKKNDLSTKKQYVA